MTNMLLICGKGSCNYSINKNNHTLKCSILEPKDGDGDGDGMESQVHIKP